MWEHRLFMDTELLHIYDEVGRPQIFFILAVNLILLQKTTKDDPDPVTT